MQKKKKCECQTNNKYTLRFKILKTYDSRLASIVWTV